MSIEKITEKILLEAEEKAGTSIGEGKAKAEEILKLAKEKAANLIDASRIKALEDKEVLIARRKSVADIDSQKVILLEKQKIIKSCFEASIQQIVNMEEAKYIDLLVNLGIKSRIKKGVLVFNKKDRETIGEKVVSSLNAKIDGADFELGKDEVKVEGGYLLICGKTSINNTIEALVEESKGSLTGKVAEILFSN